MSLEKVYAKVNVKPREKCFSSFIWSASYSESATLSRKRATFVNRGKARSNCCGAMVGCRHALNLAHGSAQPIDTRVDQRALVLWYLIPIWQVVNKSPFNSDTLDIRSEE